MYENRDLIIDSRERQRHWGLNHACSCSHRCILCLSECASTQVSFWRKQPKSNRNMVGNCDTFGQNNAPKLHPQNTKNSTFGEKCHKSVIKVSFLCHFYDTFMTLFTKSGIFGFWGAQNWSHFSPKMCQSLPVLDSNL